VEPVADTCYVDDTRTTARNEAAEIVCALRQYSFHGSTRTRSRRRGTVRSVQLSGGSRISFQPIGMETVAPGRARRENAQTDVLVRLFLK